MLATASQPTGGFSLRGVSSSTTDSTPIASAAMGQRKRAVGGFLDDDSDSEDERNDQEKRLEGSLPPPAKKRMLEHESGSDAGQEVGGTGVSSALGEPASQSEFAAGTSLADTDDDDTPIPDAQVIPDKFQEQLGEEDRYDLLFRSGPSSLLFEPELPRQSCIQTCSGQSIPIRERKPPKAVPYEAMVAARSRTKEGRAKRSFYGIDIHELIDRAQKDLKEKKIESERQAREREREREQAQAQAQAQSQQAESADKPMPSVEAHTDAEGPRKGKKKRSTMLWTEKYRARSFMDLVGDDLTNRLVLRWLKQWDPVVFPHAAKARRRPVISNKSGIGQHQQQQPGDGERAHRKILILTGPPGLGKTTLAHVCARQAGYEVLEINASDDRSRDVVNGRIRTSLGTESVKTVEHVTSRPVTKAKAAAAAAAAAGGGGEGAAGAAKTGGAFSLLAASTAQVHEKTVPAAKVARPVCVIVDEVDGVVGGSGASGEGGFVKALIDLVLVDQRNSGGAAAAERTLTARNKRKKDDFRQMRPLILICNDVYHPSLRPLRQSGLAEVVHVGKPSAETVVMRLKSIFEKEGIACEKEAARKLCEAAWGMATSGQEARRGAESTAEGDLRGVMVVGEWVARRLRAMTAAAATAAAKPQLTRQWVDRNVISDMAYGSGGGGGVGARGLGRGGVREIVSRVFQEGAGFPKTAAGGGGGDSGDGDGGGSEQPDRPRPSGHQHEQPNEQMGFAEHQRRLATQRLREMVETSGDVDRIMTEVFAEYPNREFNDDLYLSKPDAAYEWLHFHDMCTRRVFGSQEWELAAYTSQPVLACHELFATSRRHIPGGGGAGGDGADGGAAPSAFSGPRADFTAREAEKQCRAALQAIQAQLPPSLLRALRNAEDVAVDFLPYLVRLVSPDVKPVLVNVSSASSGSSSNKGMTTSVASVRREGEKVLVRRAASVLAELGISLQRGMLEQQEEAGVPSAAGRPQWVYRMEPDIDSLAAFETAGPLLLPSGGMPTRYAVRQVLDQELRKTIAQREAQARQARFQAGRPGQTGETGEAREAGQIGEPGKPEKPGAATLNKERGKGPGAAAAAAAVAVKRDFFGRIIATAMPAQDDGNGNDKSNGMDNGNGDENGGDMTKPGSRVWVTFHEGLNNAVKKPMTVEEFVRGL